MSYESRRLKSRIKLKGPAAPRKLPGLFFLSRPHSKPQREMGHASIDEDARRFRQSPSFS
jgi:hypothetical protein